MLTGVIRKAVSFVAVLGLASVMALPTLGQVAEIPEEGGSNSVGPPSPGDIQTLYNSAGLDVLDATAFGDNVDIDTGALSFQHTYINLPGNSDLPVALTKRFSRPGANSAGPGSGGWETIIPHIRQKYVDNRNSPVRSFGDYFGPQENRCTTDNLGGGRAFSITIDEQTDSTAPSIFQVLRTEWHDGFTLVDTSGANQPLLAPGRSFMLDNGQLVLTQPGFSAEFPDGEDRPRMVTKSNWKIYCGPTSNNQGEGFIGIAPNGDRYEFSRRVAYRHKHENRYFLFTEAFFVTKITDVHGNWVRYNYNDGGKLSITSNDGRRIDYSGGRAIANGRTWTFSHSTNPNLELGFKVTLPDGTYWEMGRLKNSGTYSPFQVFSRDREQCPHFDWQDYYIKHPAGSTATFSFDVILNGKYKLSDPIENIDYGPHITGLPEISSCGPVGNPLSHPSVFRSLAVTKKVVTVPQDGTHTWTWEYNNQDYGSYETFGSGRNSTIGPIKTRKTTKPDGSYMITHVNRQFGKMEG